MRIALCGTGNMGRAIVHGLMAKKRSYSILAYDTSQQALSTLPEEVKVKPPEQWFSAAEAPDAVIIAVKPADIPAACTRLFSCASKAASPAPLWISIAAGIGIDTLRKFLSADSRICRVMPNLPLRIGEGMSALCFSEECAEADRKTAEEIFSSCGRIVVIAEKLMHAVTGLSGSGPAYVFLFIEALIEGGVTAGLPLSIARECAVQTVLGAASMLSQNAEHPGQLKTNVMSPGGTTAAGLLELERNAFKHAVIKAVTAAAGRSAQLGE